MPGRPVDIRGTHAVDRLEPLWTKYIHYVACFSVEPKYRLCQNEIPWDLIIKNLCVGSHAPLFLTET